MAENKKEILYEVVASDGRGGIKLIQKDNVYYLKFPSHICRAVWSQRQKLLSLGLRVKSGDKKAEADSKSQALGIWRKACEDAASELGYEKIKNNHQFYNPDNIYKLIGDAREKCPGLYEICFKWFCEQKTVFSSIEEATKIEYEFALKQLKTCPHQDLFESEKIKEWLIEEEKAPRTVKRILRTIKSAIKWGRQKRLIPDLVSINIEEWNQDLVRVSEPRSPQWAKDKGYLKPGNQYKGFSPKDERTILEEFKHFSWGRKYSSGQFYNYAKLKFLTGCRTGEGMALKWSDFEENENSDANNQKLGILSFNSSFSQTIDKEKSIKNHKPHQIPCDKELRDFLLSIRPIDYEPSDYIIEPTLKGRSRSYFEADFQRCWSGNLQNKRAYYRRGLIEKLLDEKKIAPIFRSPYATRHTFINRQLNAGIPIGTVAAWVGDDPTTLYKNYVGADSSLVPVRQNTTVVQPEFNPNSPAPTASADAAQKDELVEFLKRELESQREMNSDLQRRFDEVHEHNRQQQRRLDEMHQQIIALLGQRNGHSQWV
jgi:integrase